MGFDTGETYYAFRAENTRPRVEYHYKTYKILLLSEGRNLM